MNEVTAATTESLADKLIERFSPAMQSVIAACEDILWDGAISDNYKRKFMRAVRKYVAEQGRELGTLSEETKAERADIHRKMAAELGREFTCFSP
jgi:molybdopterin-guanine dinucleotide biosynthesis protein A